MGNIGTYLSKAYNTGDEDIQKDSIYLSLYNPLVTKNRKRKWDYMQKKVLLIN